MEFILRNTRVAGVAVTVLPSTTLGTDRISRDNRSGLIQHVMRGAVLGLGLLAALLGPRAVPSWAASGQPQTRAVWFDDLRAPLTLTPEAAEMIGTWVAAALRSPGTLPDRFPIRFRDQKSPRIVFLSVSDGRMPAHVSLGRGADLVEALRDALSPRFRVAANGYVPRWIKIDIVQNATVSRGVDLARPLTQPRSLQGLAFSRTTGIALLPGELVARSLVSHRNVIRPKKITAYLKAVPDRVGTMRALANRYMGPVYRFTTTSLFTDGRETVPLYRGHRLFDRPAAEDLLAAAKSGGAYLLSAIEPNGRFVYNYRPKTDDTSPKYNILRHAGATLSLLDLYEVTSRPELLDGARRAIAYLLGTTRACPTPAGSVTCVVEGDFTKLGGNALAALALAKFVSVTGDRSHLPILRQFGTWIVNSQMENGNFAIHKQTHPEGTVTGFVSRFYPGEAVFALARLYGIDTDERWLDAAEKAATYLINGRDGNVPDVKLPHDHWLLYALNELYRHRPKSVYRDHAFRLANVIVAAQNRQPRYRDWLGSFHKPPSSTPTATRVEGLTAAHALAMHTGRTREAARYLDAIWLAVAFQLQTQFRPESVLYLRNPHRALGGFHRTLTNYTIRIDYVQHNISGLLSLYRIIKRGGH